MGLLDYFFGNNSTPTVSSILPDVAKQEILAGRLPHINTDNVFLKKGEYCVYIDKAILLKDKVRKIHKHHGSSAPGIFFEDIRHHYGTGWTKEVVETQQFKAILYITNQRIILQCKDNGFDKSYKYLSTMKPYTNGIELQFGNKTYSIVVPEGDIAYQAIQLIQQRRSIY